MLLANYADVRRPVSRNAHRVKAQPLSLIPSFLDFTEPLQFVAVARGQGFGSADRATAANLVGAKASSDAGAA